MILPGSYTLTVVLLVLSLLCWGSWANTFKLAGKWRYELYYLDFAIGMVLVALVAALTFGTLGWDGFSFLDDVRNAGKRQDLFAFLAGAVFNLGNMFLMAAISLAGLSVAFPIGMGLALVIGVVWNYFAHPGGNPVFLALGSLAVILAILLTVMAHRSHMASVRRRQPAAPTVKGKAPAKISSYRAILLAAAGGLFAGSFFPLIEAARETEIGLGPYSIAFIFSAGVLATTLVYNLFFMNLPVQGQPVELVSYFKGSARQHLMGLLGGMLFSTGTIAILVPFRAEGAAHAGTAMSYAMGQGAAVLSTIWGLIVWKEFADSDAKPKTFMLFAVLLLTAGIAAVALAPRYSAGS